MQGRGFIPFRILVQARALPVKLVDEPMNAIDLCGIGLRSQKRLPQFFNPLVDLDARLAHASIPFHRSRRLKCTLSEMMVKLPGVPCVG
jgi:hypothetical protein